MGRCNHSFLEEMVMESGNKWLSLSSAFYGAPMKILVKPRHEKLAASFDLESQLLTSSTVPIVKCLQSTAVQCII